MTHEEIQRICDEAAKKMLELGFISPSADYWVQSHKEGHYFLRWGKWPGTDSKCFHGSPDEAHGPLIEWLNEQPSKVDRERNQYAKKLADAIEYGKSIGVEDVLVNPLIEAMQRLSSNVIELQPSKVEDDGEIPF